MLLYLILTVISEFHPEERPNCLTSNYCPKSIKNTLDSILEKQYCGCHYPNSKVQIDETVQKIPSYSFYGSTIQELKLHSQIQSIDEGAFGNCSIKLDLSEAINLKIIGDGSFYSSKISPIIIFPNTIETIGSYAFANSTTLKRAIIRSKIIKSNAFLGCYNMICEKIEISGSGYIQNHAFHDCYQLNGILIIHDAIDRDENNQLVYSTIGQSSFQNSGITKLELSQIKSIGTKCFYNCSKLFTCSNLNSEIINNSAFENDYNLQVESIISKYIGSKSFQNCHKINPKINLDGFIDKSSFKNCEKIDQRRLKRIESGLKNRCGDVEYELILTSYYGNKYNCRIYGNGKMSSSCYYQMYDSDIYNVQIEEGVTSISYYAFYDFKNLESITIAQTVTSIGYYSFYNCEKLQSITIPNSVTEIEYSAFYNCKSLTSITIPNKVTKIQHSTFCLCTSLITVNLPNTLTYIQSSAFEKCSSLQTITLPNTLIDIQSSAFENCSSLQIITLPNSVTNLGFNAFRYCINLRRINIPDKIEFFYVKNVLEGCYSLSYIDIGSSFRSFDAKDFDFNCHVYYTVSDDNAYYKSYDGSLYSKDSKKLLKHSTRSTITYISGVTEFGKYSFYRCDFSRFVFPNTLKTIQNNAFADCYFIEEINIPNTVEYIGSSCFYNCSHLRHVSIPSSVDCLKDSLFCFCIKLQSIQLSEGLKYLESKVFYNCFKLISITLPNTVYSIGSNCFYSCYNLEYVNISDKITSIDDFYDCYSLTEVYIGESLKSLGNTTFHNKGRICFTVSEKNAYFEEYEGSLYLKQPSILLRYYINSKNFKDSITEIGPLAFSNCYLLYSLTIPDTVTFIGESAFANCSNLQKINIPDKVTEINNNVFENCYSILFFKIGSSLNSFDYQTVSNKCLVHFNVSKDNSVYESYKGSLYLKNPIKLLKYCIESNNIFKNGVTEFVSESFLYGDSSIKHIDIPNSITSIGNNCFQGCYNLSSISIPNSITSIGSYCFSECYNLLSINMPNNVNIINDYCFYKCYNLLSINIPNSATSIGNYCFYECYNLSSINLPNSITSIGNYCFYKCYNLSSINLPNSITSIGIYCFSECINLNNISLTNNIKFISNYSFYRCYNLVDINISTSVTSIGYSAFSECYNLTSIFIPDSVIEIGKNAFSYCSQLKNVYLSNNLNYIGDSAFELCESLVYLIIPEKVTFVGKRSFACCNLKLIILSSDNIMFEKEVFEGNLNCTLFYTKTNQIDYNTDNNPFDELLKVQTSLNYENETLFGHDVSKSLLVNENDHKIKWLFDSINYQIYVYGSGQMTNYKSIQQTPWFDIQQLIKGVNFIGFVSSIGSYSFSKCKYLLSVNFNEKVDYISTYSFSECPYLTLLNFEGSIKTIENCSFTNSKITTILYNGNNEPVCNPNAFSNEKYIHNQIEVYVNNNTFNYFCGISTTEDQVDEINFPNFNSIDDNFTFVYVSPSNYNNTDFLNSELVTKFRNNYYNYRSRIAIIYSNYFSYFSFILNESFYIRPIKDSTIQFKGGNLNLNIDDIKNLTILLNNNNNNNNNKISIKGSGDINFKVTEIIEFVEFEGNFHVNNKLNIFVPNEVKTVSIDCVEYEKDSNLEILNEFGKKVQNLICKKIILNVLTNLTLSNLTIVEKLQIYQTANVNLENVSFENVAIEYIIFNYNDDVFDPFIGSIKNKPKSFAIIDKKSSIKIMKNKKKLFQLLKTFPSKDDCNNWLNIVNLNNSFFDSKYCDDNNNLMIKKGAVEVEKKKKFGKNEMIGLIVGVVAAVIIIVSLIVNLSCDLKDPVGNCDSMSV